MIDEIEKYSNTDTAKSYVFTILLPTWNNIDYLKLCLRSINSNSTFSHQIIVVVNEGSDGTVEWIKSQKDIDCIISPTNIGICLALNACRSLIKTDYVAYANDDMYFLPGWDKILFDEIQKLGHKSFMLSSTMIEPLGYNTCTVTQNFGTDIATFKEQELLKQYSSFIREDWNGSTWPPNVMHIDCWDLVGGMSIEFSPGMYSDPDLSRKLWQIGVRHFVGKGNSLVYHFGCKSTGRVKKNKGQYTFIKKWGITSRTFSDKYVLRGQHVSQAIKEPIFSRFEKMTQLVKQIRAILR
jgi:glycosyltransferase involved in cell wall biosynthesis